MCHLISETWAPAEDAHNGGLLAAAAVLGIHELEQGLHPAALAAAQARQILSGIDPAFAGGNDVTQISGRRSKVRRAIVFDEHGNDLRWRRGLIPLSRSLRNRFLAAQIKFCEIV